MIVRNYKTEDYEKIRKIYEQRKIDHLLPTPEYMSRMVESLVIEDPGTSEMVTGIIAEPTVELYLFMNPNWGTPGWRNLMLNQVHKEMRFRLQKHGFSQAHIWLPPEMKKSFGRRLVRNFQWTPVPDWPCYSKEIY